MNRSWDDRCFIDRAELGDSSKVTECTNFVRKLLGSVNIIPRVNKNATWSILKQRPEECPFDYVLHRDNWSTLSPTLYYQGVSCASYGGQKKKKKTTIAYGNWIWKWPGTYPWMGLLRSNHVFSWRRWLDSGQSGKIAISSCSRS